MPDLDKGRGKVELKIGDMSFVGEGDQDWLDGQISRVLEAAMSGQLGATTETAANVSESAPAEPTKSMPLPSYIKAKGGDTVQVQRFLATAAWLYQRGTMQLTTRIVAKTLRENHQKKLSNPADCLNKNVSKGYCEKKPDGTFFITSDGWDSLGERQ